MYECSIFKDAYRPFWKKIIKRFISRGFFLLTFFNYALSISITLLCTVLILWATELIFLTVFRKLQVSKMSRRKNDRLLLTEI